MCRKCAQFVTGLHFRLARKIPGTQTRCIHETVDRCPTCRAANRETNWGGMSAQAALAETKKHYPDTIGRKSETQRGFDFG